MIGPFPDGMLLTARLGVCVSSGPRTTQVNIDDNRLILEVRINITACVWEVCICLPPRARIRIVIRDVVRNTSSHEIPHPDASTPPLQGHNATTGAVVIFSKSGLVALHSTARLVICIPVTIFVCGRARLLALVVHFTVRCCMQGHLVARVCKIDGLHDIDFAIGRPVVDVGQPKSWPGPTAMGCVIDVEDEQAFVVGGLGGHTHTVATR